VFCPLIADLDAIVRCLGLLSEPGRSPRANYILATIEDIVVCA